MILAKPGVLGKALVCPSATSTDSTNVIQMAATDWAAYTDLWWVVDTVAIATGDGSDTYQFQLLLSAEATLDTNVEVLSRTVTGYQAWSLGTAGNHIICCNIGKMLNEVIGTGLSDKPYVGVIAIVSSGGAVTVDISLSPHEPPTTPHAQIVDSNVGIPAMASAGS